MDTVNLPEISFPARKLLLPFIAYYGDKPYGFFIDGNNLLCMTIRNHDPIAIAEAKDPENPHVFTVFEDYDPRFKFEAFETFLKSSMDFFYASLEAWRSFKDIPKANMKLYEEDFRIKLIEHLTATMALLAIPDIYEVDEWKREQAREKGIID